MKIPGPLCFSGQAQLAQNFECKNMFYAVEYFRANSVFQGKCYLLKNPENKKIRIQHSEFKAPSAFQSKHKLLKTPECKKYIQCSDNFQGKLCFSGQVQLAQKSWMIKNAYSMHWKFQGNSVFQGKRNFLKTPEKKNTYSAQWI